MFFKKSSEFLCIFLRKMIEFPDNFKKRENFKQNC